MYAAVTRDIKVTVKPVALVADALLDASERGDAVLDPFAGSGTVFLAAHRTGRVAYGIEIDPLYVDTAIRRWQRQTDIPARHATTGDCFDEVAARRMVVADGLPEATLESPERGEVQS